MDKALFKRLVRGLGLPVVDWREVARAALGGDRDGVLAELEAFAAGHRRPAADGQAGAPRLVGRDDARPRRRGARRPRSRRRSATTTSRSSSATSPGARDLEVSVIGNDPAALELYGPGEIVAGHEFYDYAAKYTPGLSETLDARRGRRRADARLDPQARARRLPGDRCRGLRPRRLPAGRRRAIYVSEINTIPGFTPISLFPTMPADGGYDFGAVCRRVVDLAARARERRARRPARLTAADLPAMSGVGRAAPAGRRLTGPARPVGRPARRAPRSAARRPGCSTPVRAGAALLAMRPRRARVYGVGASPRSPTARLEVDGPAVTARSSTAASSALGSADAAAEPFLLRPTHALEPALETLPAVADAEVDRRAARTVSRSGSSEREPVLVWQVGEQRFLVDDDGRHVRHGRPSLPASSPARPAARRSTTGARARPDARGSATSSTRSTSTPRPGSARSRRPTSAAARRRSASTIDDEHGFIVTPAPPAGGASSASTRRRSARPSSSPARSACCGSLLAGREATIGDDPRWPTTARHLHADGDAHDRGGPARRRAGCCAVRRVG